MIYVVYRVGCDLCDDWYAAEDRDMGSREAVEAAAERAGWLIVRASTGAGIAYYCQTCRSVVGAR